MAINMPSVTINELEQQSTVSDTDYLIVGGDDAKKISFKDLYKALYLAEHPVEDIVMNTSGVNPGTIYGGTWVAWGSGRVPVGVDESQTEFNAVEKTGGAKTHKLTIDQMPSHRHAFTYNNNNTAGTTSYAHATGGYGAQTSDEQL